MTPIEDIIDELRNLRKEIAAERRRRNQTMVTGTVEEVKGSRVKVRIAEDGEDGPVITPWLRIADRTGKRQAGVSRFTKFGIGESVLVTSPNGEIGTMSAVTPWIDTEDDPSPGKAEDDGDLHTIGSALVETRNGLWRAKVGGASIAATDSMIKLSIGSAELTMNDGLIYLKVGGTRLTLMAGTLSGEADAITWEGSTMTHNGANVGDTHVHGGIVPGGANTTGPAN